MRNLQGEKESNHLIIKNDCLKVMSKLEAKIDLTFLDPPFNQQKNYASHNDNLPELEYWEMMRDVCANIYKITSEGGALYFMQREKYRTGHADPA